MIIHENDRLIPGKGVKKMDERRKDEWLGAEV